MWKWIRIRRFSIRTEKLKAMKRCWTKDVSNNHMITYEFVLLHCLYYIILSWFSCVFIVKNRIQEFNLFDKNISFIFPFDRMDERNGINSIQFNCYSLIQSIYSFHSMISISNHDFLWVYLFLYDKHIKFCCFIFASYTFAVCIYGVCTFL